MNDRRRVKGPSGGTSAPAIVVDVADKATQATRPTRSRAPNALRKIFLKTGVTPSASGSAYLEYESQARPTDSTLTGLSSSGLKISCTVHGPRPLPRSAPFTPHIILGAHVKYAPFATRQRRGYLRDASERDLAVHLETALRGVIIGDRWPKSGVDVIITILEGEEDNWHGDAESKSAGQLGMMNVLSGCITAACAAIADAGIDCVDMVSGGVAALVKEGDAEEPKLVLDPVPSEHEDILAACVVGYLPSRDEITDLWVKGDMDSVTGSGDTTYDILSENAIQAAKGSHHVLSAALTESVTLKLKT